MSNFLGSPFNPWVKKQIDARQKSLGKYSNIPEQDLLYYNTKTPFLRLASSVNLTKGLGPIFMEDSVLKKLVDISGIPESEISGNQLAKKLILQGGVVADIGDSKTSGLKFGLNNGKDLFNGAYGWGGTSERGYVPMPGITSATVIYQNNGALSKTTVNIKCFSKAQFELIDVLYLRPGYSLLLEFGWSQYLDSEDNGKLKNFDNFYTKPLSAILNGGVGEDINQFKMFDLIKTARKDYRGNYEGVFGKISNFNWSFNTDGSYDIVITITGFGDVVESLKINLTSPYPNIKNKPTKDWLLNETSKTTSPPLIANAKNNLINEFLFSVYQDAKKSKAITSDPWSSTFSDLTIPKMVIVSDVGDIVIKENFKFTKAVMSSYGTTGDTDPEITPQVYIKYGAFLGFIQSQLLLYSKNNSPIVSFDINFNNLDKDENVILKVGGQFSADPRICLIPYENVNLGPELNLPKTNINDSLAANTAWNYSTYLGRLSNIMVNVNYITEVINKSPKSDSGNISLLDFLKTLNRGIISSLGGINKFEIKVSDDNNKIIFIEDIPQRRDEAPPEPNESYARFNVFGVKPGIEGSFVRNISLNSDLSSDAATMIINGAQLQSNNATINSTPFGKYNAGLIDRIIEEKVNADQPPSSSEEGDKETITSNFNTNINSEENSLFKAIYVEGKLLQENIDTLTSLNFTHASLITGELTIQKQLQSPFFIPFNLSLEMDGLSGMRLYEKFLITDNVLPPSYNNDKIDLQLTAVNHTVDPSAWTTNISTMSVPAETLSPVSRPQELKSKVTGQVSSGAPSAVPPTSLIEPPASLDPTSRKRFDAMQSSYNGVFNRDGEVSGMCARWTVNMAAAYMEFLRGKPLPSIQISAGGNANNNTQYYNNLTKLGYKKTISTGITKAEVIRMLNTPNNPWGYGDVVAYYANVGSGSHRQYGHTQIYVGEINNSKWSTSTKTNYNTSFPYTNRNSNNWNLLIFRAPSS